MDAAPGLDDITDLETLRGVARQAILDFQSYKERCRELENTLLLKEERIAELLRQKYGRSSEKLTAGIERGQGNLFDEIEKTAKEAAAGPDEPTSPVKGHVRRRGKRAKLPDELPRIEEIIDIDEADKVCPCGATLVKIGEETSEKLEVIPARFVVRRTIRPRYACPGCGGTENEPEPAVLTAPLPPTILPKANATPSLLSTIAAWKFQDGLPLYRQEGIFARHGIELGRATMSRWLMEVAGRLQPLVAALETHIRSGPMIGMDETTLKVLGESERQSPAYMWLARGGPPGQPAVRFFYRPTREAAVPQAFLFSYRGVLQTDGLEVYDAALRALAAGGEPPLLHAGCMAHARRQFVEADKSGKVPGSAKVALGYIQKLYAIEKRARTHQLEETAILALRQREAVPILADFKEWLDGRAAAFPPKSLIGKAIAYTLGQWPKLVQYANYGFVPIDNNLVENAIRPFVIGRKNFLFSGSPAGADASAALYSLIETAKANGHEPFFYLFFLFSMFPRMKDDAVKDLLPFNCTRKQVNDFAVANWARLGS